jgi:hypothetical protein
MGDVLDELQSIANPIIDRFANEGLGTLTYREQVFLLVWAYGSEVANGGHAQFFCNSLGEFAEQTVDALIAVGCLEFAEQLQRLIRLFPQARVPLDIGKRNDVLEDVLASSEYEFEQADQKFFSTRGDSLTLERLQSYWSATGV